MFIAQVLVGPSKLLKQIIQIEHNIVKNPNWPEANQLVIYKRSRGFDLGATEKQIQVVVRAGLERGTAGLRVRHADHSATLPPTCGRYRDLWYQQAVYSTDVCQQGFANVTSLIWISYSGTNAIAS